MQAKTPSVHCTHSIPPFRFARTRDQTKTSLDSRPSPLAMPLRSPLNFFAHEAVHEITPSGLILADQQMSRTRNAAMAITHTGLQHQLRPQKQGNMTATAAASYRLSMGRSTELASQKACVSLEEAGNVGGIKGENEGAHRLTFDRRRTSREEH